MYEDRVKESISMLINYFLSIRDGNDAYSLRYHTIMLIYKVSDEAFPKENFNANDIYNLQYNYEKFCSNKVGNKYEMLDLNDLAINSYDLEKRLQEYLNKMFLSLAVIIKKYGVVASVPIR